MNNEELKKIFDKTNLELLLECVKKHKIQSNSEYGPQFIYLICNILENLENTEIINHIFDIKFIDIFLEELDSRKIEENILRSLFLLCATISENHLKFLLTENQVKYLF